MLPDLALLTNAWQRGQEEVATNPIAWVQILPPDPMRWYINFSAPSQSLFLVSNFTDTVFDVGMPVPNGGPQEIEYKKFGPTCGLEWWIYGKGGGFTVTAFWSSIIGRGR